MEKAVIMDIETEEKLTLTQLKSEYVELKESGDTEAEDFESYLANITDGNGTCVWL